MHTPTHTPTHPHTYLATQVHTHKHTHTPTHTRPPPHPHTWVRRRICMMCFSPMSEQSSSSRLFKEGMPSSMFCSNSAWLEYKARIEYKACFQE